jgi:formylglycine-generating enzyme required for sulfatase activity
VRDGGYSDKWRSCWTQAGWQWKGDRSEPDKYGGVFDLPNHPAVVVSWYEALAFCNWLGQKLGMAVSLPTEAQWERAARGTDGRTYPWGEEITPNHANYDETGIAATTAVGIFPRGANPETGATGSIRTSALGSGTSVFG